MAFSFIHISDHHLLESEQALDLGFSPAYAFRQVMRHIQVHTAAQVDFILSTGDAVEQSSVEGYRQFARMLDVNAVDAIAPGPLYISMEGLQQMPLYLLPGNHDHRGRFLKQLFPATKPAGLINVTFMHKGVRFVCLDWGQATKAVIYAETLDFLRQELTPQIPTMLVMHHHPLPTGYRWMDAFMADDIDQFWQLLEGHAILGVLFGHTHQTYEGEVAGIPAFGIRSTSYAFAPMDEPLPCLLPPQYRLLTVKEGRLSSQVLEVRI